jgi:hypothetical protein
MIFLREYYSYLKNPYESPVVMDNIQILITKEDDFTLKVKVWG